MTFIVLYLHLYANLIAEITILMNTMLILF